LDRRVEVPKSVLLEPDAEREVVVTPWGIVLVNRQRGWTWYRWMMAHWFHSVTVEAPGRVSDRRMVKQAHVLMRDSRERARQPSKVRAW
jgi:hypothetical protein